MADIEPPSFSLGFDLDLDSELRPAPAPAPETSSGINIGNPARTSPRGTCLGSNPDEDDDFETPPVGYGASTSEPPSSTLKRLRHGPALTAERPEPKVDKFTVDDDIEEFSSQDDEPPNDASKYHHSVCSSSKFPLNGHGSHVFLASQATRQLNETRSKNQESSSASIDKEVGGNKSFIPELHVSPLRRFQLIESDSDEASPSKFPSEVINKVGLPSIGQFKLRKFGTPAELKTTKSPQVMSPANDLWKDICSDRSFHIPTPALDEFCEEHSRSLNNKNKSHNFDKDCHVSSNLGRNETGQIASGSPHPASLYYYHEDSRIRDLVRARLPHFLPLCCVNYQGSKQDNTPRIDYITQFNHKEPSKRGKKNHNVGSSSANSRKNARKTSAVDVQEESGSWINPRVSNETTLDAGKKRVRGVESAGHWYTGPNGRRIYVAGNGQELSGQAAYRQYKRESGGGFKKSNKKASSKKKSAKKK